MPHAPPHTPVHLHSSARALKRPRPVLAITQSFVVTLDVADLRLILRALGGRLRPEDVELAHALGEHLTFQRATRTQQICVENEKLLENLENPE